MAAASSGMTSATPVVTDMWTGVWLPGTGQWKTGETKQSGGVTYQIDRQTHPAVAGALEHFYNGTWGKRASTRVMIQAIESFVQSRRSNVVDPLDQKMFANAVFERLNTWRRSPERYSEKLRDGLISARTQLEEHYAVFDGEAKSDEQLIAMFQQLKSWAKVVTSEQRRIAGLKKHDKEERLIANSFGGDRDAYNRFKARNEAESRATPKEVSSAHQKNFADWLDRNPDYFNVGSCNAQRRSGSFWLFNHRYIPDRRKADRPQAFDVSVPHMVGALGSVLEYFTSGEMKVCLEFDRSPKVFVSTTISGELIMHGCDRLISGREYDVVGLIDELNPRLVFKSTVRATKRLPEEYQNKFKAQCTDLYKTITCHFLYEFSPSMIRHITVTGYVGDTFHKICLRQTSRANKMFSAARLARTAQESLAEKMRTEAKISDDLRKEKHVRAQKNMRKNRQHKQQNNGNQTSSVVEELSKLATMREQGILSQTEFEQAKRRVLNR